MARRKRALALAAGGITVAGALIGLFLLFTAGSASAKEFATLRIIQGHVRVAPAGSSTFHPAVDRQTLREGDTVKTGPDGRAELDYFDGSITRLDFSSTFHIRKLRTLNNGARSKVIVGNQTAGSSYNRITKLTDSQSRVQVVTPTATASVQGTIFTVEINPDGSSTVIVLEGAVAVHTPHGLVIVHTGQKVTLAEDGTPGAVTEATAEDLAKDTWIQFNDACDAGADPNCADLGGTGSEPSPSPSATATESPSPEPSPTGTGGGGGGGGGSSPGPGPGPSEDTTPPDTAISTGPSGTVGSNHATFGFVSSESDSTFECSLDGGVFSSCVSPDLVSNLDDGAHEFSVRAIDPSDNVDPTPAVRDWSVDTTPPGAPVIGSGPAAQTNETSATFTFGQGSSRHAASAADLGYLCSIDSGVFTTCSSGVEYAGLGEGAHDFAVKAVDEVANQSDPATWSWHVDLTAPTVTITEGPADPTNHSSATFDFSLDDPDATTKCSLDGADFSSCGSGVAYSGLADGSHSFEVKATDPAGNEGSDSKSWSIDTTAPPTPVISSGPDSQTNLTEATFSFGPGASASSPSGDTYECSLDGVDYTPCDSPLKYSGLVESEHFFHVRAVDDVGNRSAPAAWSWTIDLTPPQVTIDPIDSLIGSSSLDVGFSVDDPTATTACSLDGGPAAPCSPPTVSLHSLLEGTHTIEITATDPAGNTGSASRSWSVDTVAPVATITDHTTVDTSASFTFTATDAPPSSGGIHFGCRLDSTDESDFQACTSPAEYSLLSTGDHTFEVRAIDAAGNVGDPDSFTWTVAPADSAPVANDDGYSVSQGDQLTVDAPGVLVNDCDPDVDELCGGLSLGPTSGQTADVTPSLLVDPGSIGTFDSAQGGSVDLSSDGSFTYTPPSTYFTGDDSFQYDVTDGTLVSESPATVTLTVEAAPCLGPDSVSEQATRVTSTVDDTITIATGVAPITCHIEGSDSTGYALVTDPNPAWHAAIAGSSWINTSGQSCCTDDASGQDGSDRSTDYDTTFDVPSTLDHPSLSVTLAADNEASVFLNGEPVPLESGPNGFEELSTFSTSEASDFNVGGSNTLRVVVTDIDCGGCADPNGLDYVATVTNGAAPVEISLTWDASGAAPNDLDLHVQTPDVDADDGGEVWAGNPCHPSGSCSSDWATLDGDGSGASRSETVTIKRDGDAFFAGRYRIWVENFSCDDASFQGSGATVTISRGGVTLRTYHVGPASGPLTAETWKVSKFDLTSGGTATLTDVQAMTGESCGSGGGSESASRHGHRHRHHGRGRHSVEPDAVVPKRSALQVDTPRSSSGKHRRRTLRGVR